MSHKRPEHIPDQDPCSRCGLPFLWHRVRHPTPEYLAAKPGYKSAHLRRLLEEKKQRRLDEARLSHTELGALVSEYEQAAPHVTDAFKRRLFEAWWETRKAAHRHQLATERLVRHLGRGPITYRGRVYLAQPLESVELEEQ